MDDPEDDPWNSPEMHKGHAHIKQNGGSVSDGHGADDFGSSPRAIGRSSHQYSASTNNAGASNQPRPTSGSVSGGGGGGGGGWGDYGDNQPSSGGFHDSSNNASNPFGGDGGGDRASGSGPPVNNSRRTLGVRNGSTVEENIVVTLMPGKEGVFMFQHHNYEVASQRRGSKVIRRYSDFVWLLDCLQKRYPFRVLPLLPPKRVAVNGNHLSNDGGFIEKRRRGLCRFLNALVRHPVLSQEQLVVMFLTVPTVSILGNSEEGPSNN
jgi:sorting nexin-8